MGLSLCVRRDFTIDAISTNWLTKFNIRWYKWLRIKNGKCLNQSHVFCPSAVLLWLWHDGWCGNLYYDHFPCCDCLMNWSAIKAFEQLTGFITLSSCLVNVTVSIVLITNRSGRQFVLCFFRLLTVEIELQVDTWRNQAVLRGRRAWAATRHYISSY